MVQRIHVCKARESKKPPMFSFDVCREKFGLHRVDFDDPSHSRTPKASATFLGKLATSNGFVEE